MNKLIIDQFTLLIDQIKFDIDYSTGKTQLKNTYRLYAIQKALKILKNYPDKITSSKQLIGIKNIGEKTLKRIDEILQTKKLSEIKITPTSTKHLQIILELENVFGIGRKTAYNLFNKYQIQSVKDLQKKYFENKISLPKNIIKGLEYVDKIKENIPRIYISNLTTILINTTLEISPYLFGVTCGSYRREKDKSNDIDFILVNTNLLYDDDIKKCSINYLYKFIQLLKQKNIIIDDLTSDKVKTKYMGICKLQNNELFRIDIRFIPYSSFYSAILYFTGSKDFNKKMRQVAINLGYTLNEYGLFNKKKQFSVNSEKDIFDYLGLEYIKPSERN
jgi:DNA polymerase/3'-5' exonuclease PolX